MPSDRKQFNVVLDDGTEELLFQLVAIDHVNATQMIKSLLASHPRILQQAEITGIQPDPASVKHGRKPYKQVKE